MIKRVMLERRQKADKEINKQTGEVVMRFKLPIY